MDNPRRGSRGEGGGPLPSRAACFVGSLQRGELVGTREATGPGGKTPYFILYLFLTQTHACFYPQPASPRHLRWPSKCCSDYSRIPQHFAHTVPILTIPSFRVVPRTLPAGACPCASNRTDSPPSLKMEVGSSPHAGVMPKSAFDTTPLAADSAGSEAMRQLEMAAASLAAPDASQGGTASGGSSQHPNVFVRGLPLAWSEAEITAVFQQYGVVSSLRLVRHSVTKQSLG
jgi:hypothetical protein